MKHYKLFAAAALLLLAAACGTYYGDTYPRYSTYAIRGTVDYVDTTDQYVQLYNVTSDNGAMTSNYGGDNVRIYYNSRTPVRYNGNYYRPQDLERGDQVSVTVAPTIGNRLNAESMSVIYNARVGYPGNYPPPPNPYPSTYPNTYPNSGYPAGSLHGTVTYVDTRHDTITVNTSNGAQTLAYDSGMPVYYNGQTYRPQDLQRGDEVDVQYNDLGNGNLQVQSINVTNSVSGGNGGYGTSSPNYATVRGTVDSIDTDAHVINLRSMSYISGFNRNVGRTMTVQYDVNTRVNINGQLYPVEGLQRGDVIDVQLQNPGATTPFVQSITLFRDINQR